jgi:hypothetical protein
MTEVKEFGTIRRKNAAETKSEFRFTSLDEIVCQL